MALKHPRWFLLAGLMCGLLFTALLLVRTGTVPLGKAPAPVADADPAGPLEAADRWMAIFQGDRKIGVSHSRLDPVAGGYRLSEEVTLRINTMGLVQALVLNSSGWLNPDLSLQRFRFSMHSGLFTFEAQGQVENGHLAGRIRSGANEQPFRVPLDAPPYLPAGIFPALVKAGLEPGTRRVFPIFDPSTMSREEVTLTLQGRETISLAEGDCEAWKVALTFKGITQEAWLDDNGQVLVENGLMGIRQVRVSREEALSGLAVAALTEIPITHPCEPPGVGGCHTDGCFAIPPCACSLCAPCGDGVCQPEYGENRCSCPADCE